MSSSAAYSSVSESAPVLLVIAGPAGSGKTTLCDRMVAEVPGFSRVVTATTREPRPGEVRGVHYHFLTPEEFGDIVLDPAGHTVTRKGEPLDLTPLEFDLLACLLGSPEQVFTREVLLQKVWGYHHPGDTKLVNVHMTRLRSKIEDDADDPQVIRTVRGVGYQAIAPD